MTFLKNLGINLALNLVLRLTFAGLFFGCMAVAKAFS